MQVCSCVRPDAGRCNGVDAGRCICIDAGRCSGVDAGRCSGIVPTMTTSRKKVHARAPTCASKGENDRARTRERERGSERENGGQTASE